MTRFQLPAPADYAENKRILAGIVQEYGGKFRNKTNLFKAYYWAHRYFWQDHRGLLTKRHHIVKMDNGPGIDRHDDILQEMVDEKRIKVFKECFTRRTGEDSWRYVFKSVARVELNDTERDSIHRALARVADRGAGWSSDDSHAESRTWRESKLGQPLDIYLDTIDDGEFARREQAQEAARSELDAAIRKLNAG